MAPGTIDPAWRTDEPADLLDFERLINAAVYIGAIAFGIHAAVFAICSYHFTKAKRFPYLQQVYVTVVFLLAAVTIGCNISHNSMTWIENRAYPGGPGAFIVEQQGQSVNTVGNCAGLILAFMVDSLLIYRCLVVWSNNFFVIILPCLMLVASTIMAILQTIAASQPQSALWNERAVLFGVPYFSLSMTLNMLVTVIIVTRLLMARRRIRGAMGPNSDHGRMYTSVAAMLVESAAPPAIVSIFLIAFYARGLPAQVLFYPLLPQVQGIAPQLIFIRVIRGRGWSKTTMTAGGMSVEDRPNFASNPSGTLASGTMASKGSQPWTDKNKSGSGSLIAGGQ